MVDEFVIPTPRVFIGFGFGAIEAPNLILLEVVVSGSDPLMRPNQHQQDCLLEGMTKIAMEHM